MNRLCALMIVTLLMAGGCTSSGRPNGVPYGGQLVGEAPGQVATFTVPHDGTIWVVGPGHPGEERYIVFSGGVKMSQVVTIDPGAQSLSVDEKKVKATIASGKVYYQIWFQPTPDAN